MENEKAFTEAELDALAHVFFRARDSERLNASDWKIANKAIERLAGASPGSIVSLGQRLMAAMHPTWIWSAQGATVKQRFEDGAQAIKKILEEK